jgi:hypothetical protein
VHYLHETILTTTPFMASFQTLQANFSISTMVEHGTLTFFLDGVAIIQDRDALSRKDIVLAPGQHEYQWQVNGTQGLTRYSIRLLQNGTPIPNTGRGPRVLQNGDVDSGGRTFNV